MECHQQQVIRPQARLARHIPWRQRPSALTSHRCSLAERFVECVFQTVKYPRILINRVVAVNALPHHSVAFIKFTNILDVLPVVCISPIVAPSRARPIAGSASCLKPIRTQRWANSAPSSIKEPKIGNPTAAKPITGDSTLPSS